MRGLLITIFCVGLFAPVPSGAMPPKRKDILPTNPVAGLKATTPIDFNSMIDANQARNETLSRRLRTKNKARALHLTRGHVRIAREQEPTRTRREASVSKAQRGGRIKNRPEPVRVVLLPRPPAR